MAKILQEKYGEVIDLRGVYQGITNECEEIKARMTKRVQEQTKHYIHSDD